MRTDSPKSPSPWRERGLPRTFRWGEPVVMLLELPAIGAG